MKQDLFRVSKSKQAVDLSPGTIRNYHRQGLPIYRRGRAAFVSLAEFELFIRGQLQVNGARSLPE